jgi:hypothetical protein
VYAEAARLFDPILDERIAQGVHGLRLREVRAFDDQAELCAAFHPNEAARVGLKSAGSCAPPARELYNKRAARIKIKVAGGVKLRRDGNEDAERVILSAIIAPRLLFLNFRPRQ